MVGTLVGSLLAFCFPLLCGASFIVRLGLRHREGYREVWTSFLCTLLAVSGLIASVAFAYVLLLKAPSLQGPSQLPLGLVSHDLAASFPSLPAAAPMTPLEIAARTKLLVFIVMPDPGSPLRGAHLENSSLGAATLLMADDAGYLLATNRHVADPPNLFLRNNADRVLVVSSQGSYAFADVIARHQDLDLALLWVVRQSGNASFRQPITRYSDLSVGGPVYVIGHPQRLFFTLSSGIISRLGGDGLVQLSAPISPGNSGGPAYDSLGNLLGIVTFTVDKQINPNAENLNFATRADALLTKRGWSFHGEGMKILKRFLQE
jgi:S1-C subfamily serine protease